MHDEPIYLDHNATTPVLPAVLDAMLPYLREHFGNPSSDHVYGHRAREAVVLARTQVAELIGCRPREIYFTSGGTEANNLAIRGVCAARPQRSHLVTSVIEHPATARPCEYLEGQGHELSRLPVDRHGVIRPDVLEAVLREDTALVSVMHANSETGSLQPVAELAALAHRVGAMLHADAAQTAGKLAFTVAELGVDLLSIVGHKMYAPKGIGALYVREGTPIAPQLLGGGHEQGLRSGTENVAYLVGLGQACAIARGDIEATALHLAGLRDHLWGLLNEGIPGLALNGHPSRRLPNTLNVRFPGVSGRDILARAPGLAAATGSACHAGDESPSAVILAMGVPADEAIGSVRLSLGRGTSGEDIEAAAAALVRAWREATAGGA